jgi:hypothetical protein
MMTPAPLSSYDPCSPPIRVAAAERLSRQKLRRHDAVTADPELR